VKSRTGDPRDQNEKSGGVKEERVSLTTEQNLGRANRTAGVEGNGTLDGRVAWKGEVYRQVGLYKEDVG